MGHCEKQCPNGKVGDVAAWDAPGAASLPTLMRTYSPSPRPLRKSARYRDSQGKGIEDEKRATAIAKAKGSRRRAIVRATPPLEDFVWDEWTDDRVPQRHLHGVVRSPEKQELQDSVAPSSYLMMQPCWLYYYRESGRRVTRKTRLWSRDCDAALAGVMSKGSHPAKATPGPAVVE